MIELSQPVARVAVSCRALHGTEFGKVVVALVTPKRARFSLPTVSPYQCFAVASDEDELPLGLLGSAKGPVDVKPLPPKPAPTLLSRWWFWSSVGAVVAGGTALALIETQQQPGKTLPHADVTVTPSGFRFR